jgi:hypothetical protein
MTSKSQLENHLQDHLPYELLMLRYSHGRINIESDPLIWNAMYECFCMHARNLWDFLNNAGTSNNLFYEQLPELLPSPTSCLAGSMTIRGRGSYPQRACCVSCYGA